MVQGATLTELRNRPHVEKSMCEETHIHLHLAKKTNFETFSSVFMLKHMLELQTSGDFQFCFIYAHLLLAARVDFEKTLGMPHRKYHCATTDNRLGDFARSIIKTIVYTYWAAKHFNFVKATCSSGDLYSQLDLLPLFLYMWSRGQQQCRTKQGGDVIMLPGSRSTSWLLSLGHTQ